MLAHEARDGLEFVERRDQHFVLQAFRDAGGIRNRAWKVARAARRETHEAVVAHTVIAALEFENLVALLVGAREPHGVEIGFRAGADEAYLLGTRHRVHDFRREPDPVLVIGEKGGALRELLLGHGKDFRVRVADQHRPRAQQIVDVFVAAHVPDAAGLAPSNHDLVGHVAEGARRQHAPRGVHEFAFGFAGLAVGHDGAPEGLG